MSETALNLVPQSEESLSPINQKALTYSETINALTPIVDQEQYSYVGMLWKNGKELLREIDEGYKDLVRAADKLHKDLVAKKAKYYNPTDAGVRAAKSLMSDYEQKQEKIRLAEQCRLADIARKEEEDRRIEEAIEAEEEAKANGATPQEAAQAAEAIISEPTHVAPVVLPKTEFIPKIKGLSFREIWSAEVFDIKLLCQAVAEGKVSTEFVMGNMPALNKQATSLKQTMNIPGVRSFSRRT